MAVKLAAPEGAHFSIFDQISDAVLVLASDGSCVYRNARMQDFPRHLEQELISACKNKDDLSDLQKFENQGWSVSCAPWGANKAYIGRFNGLLDSDKQNLRDNFGAALSQGKAPQIAAMEALRNQISHRWIAIGKMDEAARQIRFDVCLEHDDLTKGQLAPLDAKPEFHLCKEPVTSAKLEEKFADIEPFRAQGMRYFAGRPINNHLGECVAYAFLGSDYEPHDSKKAALLLEEVATLYEPYLELDTQKRYARPEAYALVDPLTGQGNRRAFEACLSEHLEIYSQEEEGDSVLTMFDPQAMRNSLIMLLNFDGFKRLNGEVGHEDADRALRLLTERLHHYGRPQDKIFRLGGDEFVQFFPRAGDLEAEDLRLRVNEIEQDLMQAGFASIGISIGVVNFFEGDGTYSSLMALADARMYHDKKLRSVHFL